ARGGVTTAGTPTPTSRAGVAAAEAAAFKPPAGQSQKPSATATSSGIRGIASAKLPFTGLPLWFVTLLAMSLLASGTALRRLAVRRTASY
ncbi:MAG TPA: hypothetical protein VJT84_11065, partial [Gaiellaceae bacterium]|nr:hypothetical protein [Gaiellaceae bacterium]